MLVFRGASLYVTRNQRLLKVTGKLRDSSRSRVTTESPGMTYIQWLQIEMTFFTSWGLLGLTTTVMEI